MERRYPKELLRELRNKIPVAWLIAGVLDVPVKLSEGYLRFLCPSCREFNTATHRTTNLARCFRCQRNFNTIDLVMITRSLNFVDAVEFLLGLRPADEAER